MEIKLVTLFWCIDILSMFRNVPNRVFGSSLWVLIRLVYFFDILKLHFGMGGGTDGAFELEKENGWNKEAILDYNDCMKRMIQQLKSNRYQEGLIQQNFLELFVLSYTLRTMCKNNLKIASDEKIRHTRKTTIPLFSREIWFFCTLSISDLQNKTEAFSLSHQ